MSMIRTLVLAAAVTALPLSAFAQEVCKAPTTLPTHPTLVAPTKPTLPAKPACAETDKCSDKVGKAYNEEIAKYNAAIGAYDADRNKQVEVANAYFKALNGYAAEFEAFMGCERKAAIAVLNGPQ